MSVLAQMAFPLHASEICEKSDTEEKCIFQSKPNRHISSRSKKFCTGGAKMWLFLGRMWQKTSQVQKDIFVCESVTFFPVVWQMWRVTFFVTEKCDKSDVTQIWDGKLGRNPVRTDPMEQNCFEKKSLSQTHGRVREVVGSLKKKIS